MKSIHLFSIGCAMVLSSVLGLAQSVEPKNTVITSDGPAVMVSNDKQTETTITFKDHVVAIGTNMKLTCDFLEVVVNRSGDPSATIGKLDKFRSMVATGNVFFVMGDREAACGRAQILPGEDKVVLSEHPVLVDHDTNTRGAGETITLHAGQRRVEIDKPILTGPPMKDLGVDKEIKPAPATPPPADAPKKP
ncbi:MAG TPA: hypothetical protein VGM64_05910 [Lacunisphaera sp.]|jgi:hypothetical protein